MKFIRTSPVKGTKAKAFYSTEGKNIRERNAKLVTLPFPGTKKYEIGQKDNLSWSAFLKFCMDYNINTFLDNPKNNEFWKYFFKTGGFK